MNTIFTSVSLVALSAVVSAAELENVALGKPYTFEPREPFYAHCTDPDDKIQLTDGEYVKGYFWVQKGCVGWMSYGAPPHAVTVDLGKDTPIRGFSWNTAFGTAGVEFPQVLHVYVSLDGKNWCFAGDLLGRATTLRIMPPPNVYNTYRAWADDMPCHGRYVKFVVQQQLCTFVDEIEVYRGPDELLKEPMSAITTTEPLMFGRDKAAALAKKMSAKLTANDPDWARDYDRSMPDRACECMLRELTAAETEYDRYFSELEAADKAADAAWDAVADQAQFKARRIALREKFLAAVGAFPERTPLNAKVVATVSREGYRVEKVLFESRPNFHVTALAFVPDATKFAPPHPAVLVTCGHSAKGKADAGYQRACVMGALEGFLMMIYDPLDQGERLISTNGSCCDGHNQFGAKAHELGLSAAHFRIWDGMRCLDYLQSRPDVKGDCLGLMGNSGGGTMTALIAAADPRVRAACPSCYITTIRDVVRTIGPQDAEQCVWGQLRDGINHASLVLMADAAVRLQFSDGDFFPIAGARSTYDVVKRTAVRVGLGDRYSATIVKGPHGWKESSRRSSLDWMRQWLMDEKPNGKTDADYVALDATHDAKKSDCGLSESEARVAPGGSVLNLPGERTVSDVLVDRAIGARTPRLVFREKVPTRHSFYGAKSAAEENAVIALMLGKNLVEEREREILAKARAVAARGEPAPVLVAEDDWVRPAERACAEAPELFAGFCVLGDGTFRTSVRKDASDKFAIRNSPFVVPRSLPDVFRPGESVLFIGDSITHGGRANDMNHYLGHGYQAEIAMRYLAYRPELGLQFENRGISGNTSSDLVARWKGDAIPCEAGANGEAGAFGWSEKARTFVPDVLNILVGVNDFRKNRVSAADYERNLRSMVTTARAAKPSMRIVICEPFALPEEDGLVPYRKAAARVASECGCIFVPFQRLFSEELVKISPRTKYWFWDTAHPTYAAHMKMADFWLRTVESRKSDFQEE